MFMYTAHIILLELKNGDGDDDGVFWGNKARNHAKFACACTRPIMITLKYLYKSGYFMYL